KALASRRSPCVWERRRSSLLNSRNTAGSIPPTVIVRTCGFSISRSSSATWIEPSLACASFALLKSIGGPQTLPPQNGSVRAFKFRDPDGHPLELLYFPPGQGRSIWHQHANDRIFLGIDHSAIGISDTSVSSAFYADLPGMTRTYATTNRGPT